MFGPDHLITLWAATALVHALVTAGEEEPARALGEDTQWRSRPVFGPDHPVTSYVTQATSSGHLMLDEDAADPLSRPL